jgi:hypothetical protein
MRPKIPEILCGIGDCNNEAIKNIELVDNATKKDVELPCCLSHALTWEIIWVFAQHDINVAYGDVHDFCKKIARQGVRRNEISRL